MKFLEHGGLGVWGALVDSVLSYASGHELGEQDRRTLIDAACAYNRNARRQELSHRYDVRALCSV